MTPSRVLTLCLTLSGLAFGACTSRAPLPPVTYTEVTPQCSESWVHMPMRINFPTSGSSMSYQDREILQQMVISASERDDLVRVRVEGHTDTCGHEANNIALSQMRAQSVASELVAMGVPAERIESRGFGSQQPVADETCRPNQPLSTQANRRVEFTLLVCR